jgi:hypothetical protein
MEKERSPQLRNRRVNALSPPVRIDVHDMFTILQTGSSPVYIPLRGRDHAILYMIV